MPRTAIIRAGTVENVVEADSGWSPPQGTQAVPSDTAWIGDGYANGAFVPKARPPIPTPLLPLVLLQGRMEAETVGATDGWTAYVNYMFALPTRRNALIKTMFSGQPIAQDNAPFRTSLNGAGFSAAQVDRILATP